MDCATVQARTIARALRVPFVPAPPRAPTPGTNLRALLSPKQREVWDLVSRVRYLLWGRRTGKTWFCAAWLLGGAAANPNSLSVYLALTKESARRIVWPAIRDVVLAAGIDPSCLHEHTLTVKLPNGAQIVCAGTDDVRTIETWRGTKLLKAVVDECGSQPAFVEYLVESILKPALMDLRGDLLCAGTPGLFCEGWWFDQTNEHRRDGLPPMFRATARDNPAIPHAAEEMTAERERSANSATYEREWEALWRDDAGDLVFPFDRLRNSLEPGDGPFGLPAFNAAGLRLDPTRWRFGLGIDVGVVDATALVVAAVHPDVSDDFVIHAEAWTGWIADNLALRVRDLKGIYGRNLLCVIDSGGMGKEHATVLARRYSIALQAAEKTEKESHVREWRDRLIAGRLRVLSTEACDPLRDEWAKLGWDKKRRLPSPDRPDHLTDAALYILRALRHFRAEDPAPEHVPGSPAWQQQKLDDLERERRSRPVQQKGRPGWAA